MKQNIQIKPITPSEAMEENAGIPDYVVQAVNNLIKEKYHGRNSFIITQKEVDRETRKVNPKVNINYLYDNNLFDFEQLYGKFGWSVEFDKAGYNETYDSYYTFKPKRKK